MKNTSHRLLLTSAACVFLVSSVGCTSLPWRAKKLASTNSPAQQYAQQAVEDTDYNAVDYSIPVPPSPYAAPTSSYSTASNGSGESCSSGCCK